MFLNIVMAVYFECGTPGRVITMASFCQSGMAIFSVQDCVIVKLCFFFFFSPLFCLLVSYLMFLSLYLQAADKSIILATDNA